MAFGYGSDFYGPEDTFAKLSLSQSAASPGIGYEAARLADPFANERKQYQNKLSTLVSDPGSFSSSPFYKFAYDQGLNALQRKGSVRSGNKLAALMKYGQDAASQLYFPQANLLSTLSGATTGSPAAAGLSVSGAFNRSQDQAQIAAAQRAGGGALSGGGGGFGYVPNSTNPALAAHYASIGAYNSANAPLPGSVNYGGGSGGGYGTYGGGPVGGSYYSGASLPYSAGGVGPSSAAGTGYVSSDYGTYDFGSPAYGDSYYTPNYGGYDSGYGGGYDYGGGGAYDYYDPGYYSDTGYYDEYE